MTRRKVVNFSVTSGIGSERGYNFVSKSNWSYEEEARLLILRSEGKTYKEIGDELHRTPNSVQIKYERIKNKKYLSNPPSLKVEGKKASKSSIPTDGCSYFESCRKCEFPACIEDGYKPNKEKNKKDIAKKWTASDDIKLDQLMRTKIGIEAMANIFNCSVKEMGRHIRKRRNDEHI